MESLPDGRGGRWNVGQPLAAGKSDVIGSLGENQGSGSLGELETVPGLGREEGAALAPLPGPHQDCRALTGAPRTWGAPAGARGSPGPPGVLGSRSPLPGDDFQLIRGTEQAWGVRGKGVQERGERAPPRPETPDGRAVRAEVPSTKSGRPRSPGETWLLEVMQMDAGWCSS